MKKIFNFIFISILAFILMMLAIFLFWELYAKVYVENYLDDNYGYAIIQTNEDLKILKNSKPFMNNDENTN
jgi:hypothetical protein